MNNPGDDALPNTGGGGGGASTNSGGNSRGGNGGSGVVIVRYLGSQKALGGSVYEYSGYTVHVFTESSSLVMAKGLADGVGIY